MGDPEKKIDPCFAAVKEYLQLPREPQPWVLDKLIPIGGLVNVYAKPKVGKSFMVLQWAKAVANGESDWEGFEVRKHGPVAYLQIDTPREEWAERLERIEWKEDSPGLWIADMWMVPEFPFNILNPQQTEMRWLREQLEKIQPVMVVIDTMREVHGGDENDSTVMRNVIANLVGVCRPAAIILISHSRKDSILTQSGDESMMDQARGSSYVAGRMDMIVKVSERRMTYKGRSGEATEVIEQIPRGQPNEGFWIVKRDDIEIERTIKELYHQYPDDSVHKQAMRLCGRHKFSLSTATRKINKWLENRGGATD